MFVFDLTFHFIGDSDDYEYKLIDYCCALSGNNQIIFETLNISGNADFRTVRVTTPYRDSLGEKYNSSYVNEALNRLMPYLKKPIQLSYIGEDFTYRDDCATGKNASYYVLCIHPHLRDFSPICCSRSKGNIPYYLLPELTEETVTELTSWETNYAAYD